jgi:hypothetical protein
MEAAQSAPLPSPPHDESVACDLLALIERKLALLALICTCRQHAEQAGDWRTVALLETLQGREREDINALEQLATGTAAERRTRAWLTETWEHGEIVGSPTGEANPAAHLANRFSTR